MASNESSGSELNDNYHAAVDIVPPDYEIDVFCSESNTIKTIPLNHDDFSFNKYYTQDTAKLITYMSLHLARRNINYSNLLEYLLRRLVDNQRSEYGVIIREMESQLSYISLVEVGGKKFQKFVEGKCKWKNDIITFEVKRPVTFFNHGRDNLKIYASDHVLRDPRQFCQSREHEQSFPEGHPHLETLISIPIVHEGKFLATLVFANQNFPVTQVEEFVKNKFFEVYPFLQLLGKLTKQCIKYKETIATRITAEANANAVKDKFLATMSHEIRTPLNGIVGMITMLKDAGPLNKRQQEYVHHLTQCSFQLTSLMNNILDFSKMASGRFALVKEPFDFQDVINTSLGMIDACAKSKGIEIRSSVPQDIPILLGDKQRLIQVLSNILSNAVKFTNKGFISLEVTEEGIRRKKTQTRRLRFVIKDSGVGIPYHEQGKIFEVFHRSGQPGIETISGTGLGLALVKELVKLMGGEIAVESDGVKGSKFMFTVCFDEEVRVQSRSLMKVLKNAKILVVDDRTELRLQLSEMLFKWGCIPFSLSSAEEALTYIRNGAKLDTAIIDVYMPYMDGVQLVREIRCVNPDLPIIGLSSVDNIECEKHFDVYMNKPIDQATLFPALCECVKKGRKKNTGSLPRTAKQSSKTGLRSGADKKCFYQRRRKPRDKLRILVAEDDIHNSFVIKEMLKNLGYNSRRIKMVENGQQCVNEVKRRNYDVILTDIIMPVMDGVEAVKHIRQITTKNPPLIVAVSAAVSKTDKSRCHVAGVDYYITKPLTKDKIEDVLSRVVFENKALPQRFSP